MIYIRNFTLTKINENFLKKTAETVLKKIKIRVDGDVELTVVIAGSTRMRNFNKKYRGKNKATDVLAFPVGKIFPHIQDKIEYLGDIIICLPVAKKQAKIKRHSAKKEMTTLLIHGILHLIGHDHEKSKKEAEKMEKLEMELFGEINRSEKL